MEVTPRSSVSSSNCSRGYENSPPQLTEEVHIQNGEENILVEAIINGCWDFVIERCQECPDEASRWAVVTVGGSRVRILPLHFACTRNPPVRVVQELINAAPETLSYVDHNGRTLLHWAVDAGGTSPEIIRTILRLAPSDTARQRGDKYGCLPLHIACCQRSGRDQNNPLTEYEQVQIVELLLDAYPEGASSRDEHRGFLPLHLATKTGAPAGVISALLEACPTATAVGDKDHRLPIHYATRYAHLWDEEELRRIFELLVVCFPAGLKRREKKSGFTPLAIACSMPSLPTSVISILLRYSPSAASIPDFNSALPLHAASRAIVDFPVIDALLCANSSGAQDCDKDGMLPLHWASMNSSVKVVERLIKAFPAGTSQREDKEQSTPLHLAVKHAADEDVILSLLYHYPRGSRAKDMSGALPIHYACKNSSKCSLRSIETLIIAYPESLKVRDYHGSQPIDYVQTIEDKDTRSAFLEVLTGSINDDDVDESEICAQPSLSLPLETVSEDGDLKDDVQASALHNSDSNSPPITKTTPSRYSTPGGGFRGKFSGLKRSIFPLSKTAAAQGRDDITLSTNASYYLCRDEAGDVKVLRGC